MSKVFFTSDTHFNHANILRYCPDRPWESLEAQTEALIANWNARVSPEDLVYHLGDFAMGDRTKIPEILSRLNGRIILIRGNHDTNTTLRYFREVHNRLEIDLDGRRLELVHDPSHARFEGAEAITFCGHVHQKWAKRVYGEVVPADMIEDHAYRAPEHVAKGNIYNVGVDVRGYQPVTLGEILDAQ